MQHHSGKCQETQKAFRKTGFTLIELLVVIAIIAILAAILFPVFARARENARRTSCSSNLKQIALGIMQYTQDYDEKFPCYYGGVGNAGWAEQIQPYSRSLQLLQCPSESTAPSSDSLATGYTDYAINLQLGWDISAGSAGAKSLAILTSPTLTVMNHDYVPQSATSWSAGCASEGNTCSAARLADFQTTVAQRHLDGMNFSFTDGHVKWYKSQNTTTSASVWNSATPGSTSGNSPTFNLTP
jgi:prepilin-type N-terminal cleavage/methylation domain-containing protein/prepilin-type processing-associated H-X9-DG protein